MFKNNHLKLPIDYQTQNIKKLEANLFGHTIDSTTWLATWDYQVVKNNHRIKIAKIKVKITCDDKYSKSSTYYNFKINNFIST